MFPLECDNPIHIKYQWLYLGAAQRKIRVYLSLEKVAEGRGAVNMSSTQELKNHNKDTFNWKMITHISHNHEQKNS